MALLCVSSSVVQALGECLCPSSFLGEEGRDLLERPAAAL